LASMSSLVIMPRHTRSTRSPTGDRPPPGARWGQADDKDRATLREGLADGEVGQPRSAGALAAEEDVALHGVKENETSAGTGQSAL
jgi:hypothetical protein